MSINVGSDSPQGRGGAVAVVPAAPGAGAGPGNLNRRTVLGGAISTLLQHLKPLLSENRSAEVF